MKQDFKEHRFWAWFRQNEEMLFSFERDREQVFDLLNTALAHVSADLTFEFGPVEDGARDFVISAGGIKSAFPMVEALVAAAPAMPRWDIIKFRPRRNPIMELTYADKTVKPQDVDFCLLSNGRELGVHLFFSEYSQEEEQKWGQIGYLLLDEALGEYDVETKIGPIKFFHFNDHLDRERYPLPMLPEMFDAHFASLKRGH